jgi:hypothetical protein
VTGTNTGAKGSRPKSVVKKTNLKSPNGSMPTSKTGAVH